MSTLERMSEQGLSPGPDRLLAAKLDGTAMHHAKWRPLTADEAAAAVASLRALAEGRADLFAELAGLALGFHEGTASEPLGRCAAELLIAAGANQDLVAQWVEEGRRRRNRPR